MKKTLLFAMMAAVLGFTACSKEEPAQTETPQKGMVLRAIVEQPADTKATFTDNEGVWHFDFEEGDIIKVTNSEIGYGNFYTFTYDGEKFVSEDAKPTTNPARWHAYFSSNDVSLVGQSGKWEDIADKYVMTGSTPNGSGDVTGENGLSITMSPKVAILKIISINNDLDINVLMGKDMWVSGYKTSIIFTSYALDLYAKETKQTLLSTTEDGVYYIAVPAGRQIVIKNGNEVIKSTKSFGLTAGNYYELTVAPFGQGMAHANGIGYVKWIQLWEGGPKFAEYNIGATSIGGCGYYYAWGGEFDNGPHKHYLVNDNTPGQDTANKLWGINWRMPSQGEFQNLIDNCSFTWTTLSGINGILFTGKDSYSSNSVFFPAAGYLYANSGALHTFSSIIEQGTVGSYWSITPSSNNHAYALRFNCSTKAKNIESKYITQHVTTVRAVMNE